MKIFCYLCILIISFFSFSHTAFSQYSKWENDVNYKGIEFEKLRYRDDGSESLYANGVLKQKTIIEGYPCHKNLTLTKEGKAENFILAEDFEVAGNLFKKNTQVIIRDDGNFKIHCLYNPVIHGYHVKKTNYKRLLFMGSSNFYIYSSGKLKYFQPVSDIEIQGVWCKPSAVRGGVALYESGKLQECTSAKDQTIQGKLVQKNFTLKFDKSGNLTYFIKEKIFGE